MSGNVQVAVILVCCVAGYLAMSFFIDAWRRSSGERGNPARPSPANDDYAASLEVLGVGRDFTPSELTARYRELLSKYHPDKTQHLGIEFQRLAEEKTWQIIRAYEHLKRSRPE